MNNFEKWKQELTVEKAANLLTANVRCSYCKIKDLCNERNKDIEACKRTHIKWLNQEV